MVIVIFFILIKYNFILSKHSYSWFHVWLGENTKIYIMNFFSLYVKWGKKYN